MRNKQRINFSLLSIFAVFGLLLSGIGTRTVNANGQIPCGQNQFDANNFSNSTKIDNKFLPLVPGTQFIMEGRSNRGDGVLPHRVVFTVTDLTKTIHGVKTVVLYDRDYNQNELAEAEITFFAQDNDGNVWNFGEYPEEYDSGVFMGAPSTWLSGTAGAQAGIQMSGKPRLRSSSYLQGLAPQVEFLDCAQVLKKTKKTCVPVDCFRNVLVTDEWSPLDPESGHQRKYNAEGVGTIQVGAVDDPEGETLVLVEVSQLATYSGKNGGESMVDIRRAAQWMDRRAYQTRPDVWGNSMPLQ